MRGSKHRIAAGTVALVALVGGGAAIAATNARLTAGGEPGNRRRRRRAARHRAGRAQRRARAGARQPRRRCRRGRRARGGAGRGAQGTDRIRRVPPPRRGPRLPARARRTRRPRDGGVVPRRHEPRRCERASGPASHLPPLPATRASRSAGLVTALVQAERRGSTRLSADGRLTEAQRDAIAAESGRPHNGAGERHLRPRARAAWWSRVQLRRLGRIAGASRPPGERAPAGAAGFS